MREEAMNMQYLMPGTYLTPIAFAQDAHAVSNIRLAYFPAIASIQLTDVIYRLSWRRPKTLTIWRQFSICTKNVFSISIFIYPYQSDIIYIISNVFVYKHEDYKKDDWVSNLKP